MLVNARAAAGSGTTGRADEPWSRAWGLSVLASFSRGCVSTAPGALPVTHIRPERRRLVHDAGIWHARELLYFLVWRDIKVATSRPCSAAGRDPAVADDGRVPRSFGRLQDAVGRRAVSVVRACRARAVDLLATGINGSSSLVGSQHLIAKVYFPRVLVPLAAVLMPAVDLLISFGMLLVLLAWYHVTPGAGVVLLPLYAALGILTAFAVTLWTSALSVRYRDARYVLPFLIQIWLFVTPVAYPASMIPERWRLVYALNPMATVVEGSGRLLALRARDRGRRLDRRRGGGACRRRRVFPLC